MVRFPAAERASGGPCSKHSSCTRTQHRTYVLSRRDERKIGAGRLPRRQLVGKLRLNWHARRSLHHHNSAPKCLALNVLLKGSLVATSCQGPHEEEGRGIRRPPARAEGTPAAAASGVPVTVVG